MLHDGEARNTGGRPADPGHGCAWTTLSGALIGLGHWDFLVEDNVDDAVALLAESVSYMSLLPRRLPAGCLNGGPA
jgi:hypothetical protein